MSNIPDYSLYLATDSRYLPEGQLTEAVEGAIAGGVTMVQLRLKDLPTGEVYRIGKHILTITRNHGVPLIVNDRVDLMLALGADGVHVGRADLPLPVVRHLAGSRIVGYSVNSLDHLRHAQDHGADYVGVGPVFATGTKVDTGPLLGLEKLAQIVRHARVPCVAIGGVTADNISSVRETGVNGCCVVSAILGADDPQSAARGLRG